MGLIEPFVLICAILPVATAVLICRMQENRLSLMHIYLVILSLSYGAYTAVDILINPPEVIDAFAVAVLMISITASMIVLSILSAILPQKIYDHVSLKTFIQKAEKLPIAYLIAAFLLVIAWRAYAYAEFDIISYYDEDALQFAGISIPGWWGPLNSFFFSTAFAIFICLTASISRTIGGRHLIYRLVMLIVIAILLSLNGRRAFLNMIIIAGFLIFVGREKTRSMFSLKYLTMGTFSFASLVFFSNLFQRIRGIYLTLGGDSDFSTVSLISALFDFEATETNLQARTATWRFHYYIMQAQLSDLTNIMGGQLLWDGFIGSIPRFLYPEKGVVYKDVVMTCQFYVDTCPTLGQAFTDIDFPSTIYSSMQADFGFLFIILAPVCILAVLWIVGLCGQISKKLASSGGLYIFMFGYAANLLTNVEQSVGNFFIFGRETIFLILSIGMIELLLARSSRAPIYRVSSERTKLKRSL